MFILSATMFFVSMMGYNYGLKKIAVPRYLTWITTVIVQTLVLYIFAMLNFLRFGIAAVMSFGILLYIWFLIEYSVKYKRQTKPDLSLKESVHYFEIWLFIGGILFVYILSNSPLIHYDNYSHWATMIKYMVFEGHLPTANQTVVTFTSYPPATALFITSFITWTGFSSGAMLIGQFLIIWSASYAMFGVLRDRTRSLNAFIICFAISLALVFNVSIRLNNLLVDFVLPLVTVAGVAGVYIYREKRWIQIAHSAMFVAMLLLIKNSGVFFALLLVGYLFYQVIKSSSQIKYAFKIGQAFVYSVVTFGIGFLPFYWWTVHVKQTFVSLSKHEVSLNAYQHQLVHENQHVFTIIAHKMLSQVFSSQSLSTIGFLLVNVILATAWGVIKFILHKQNVLLKVMIALDVAIIAYYLSVYTMYVVSMPYAEAIVLAGFERYMSSMVIFTILIGAMALAIAIDYTFFEQNVAKRELYSYNSMVTKNIYQVTSLTLFLFATILMFSEINGTKYSNQHSENTLPLQLSKIAQPEYVLNNKLILIVDTHKETIKNQYTDVVGRYYFFDGNVTGREDFMMSNSEFKKTLNKYDYVVIPEWHSTFSVMVKKVYHQNIRTGMYKVTADRLIRRD